MLKSTTDEMEGNCIARAIIESNRQAVLSLWYVSLTSVENFQSKSDKFARYFEIVVRTCSLWNEIMFKLKRSFRFFFIVYMYVLSSLTKIIVEIFEPTLNIYQRRFSFAKVIPN